MMRYKCLKCGEIIEEANLEIKAWDEYRGECWGAPAWETMTEAYCPYCQSEVEEYMEDDDENNGENKQYAERPQEVCSGKGCGW